MTSTEELQHGLETLRLRWSPFHLMSILSVLLVKQKPDHISDGVRKKSLDRLKS